MLIWAACAFGRDGTVYLAGFDMNLYALDADTAEPLWKTFLGNALVASPAVGEDGTIYQGCFDGKLYAVAGDTGKILWTARTGGQRRTKAADGGTVLADARRPIAAPSSRARRNAQTKKRLPGREARNVRRRPASSYSGPGWCQAGLR